LAGAEKGKSCESCTEKKTVAGFSVQLQFPSLSHFNNEADIDRMLVASEKLIA
jgi:hypothetical protein